MRRIDSLDGLRAVAVSLVIAGHLAPTFVPGGGVGVDIFFALSGYLITSLLLREFEATDDIALARFYCRRLGRLAPALLLVLLATAVAVSIKPVPQFRWSEIWYAGSYTMNWARAWGWSQGVLLGHTWSLGIEEQYYIIWPPVLLGVLYWRPRHALHIALAIAAASVAYSIGLYFRGAPFSRFYNGADVRAVELLIGSAAAIGLPKSGVLARLWIVPTLIIAFSVYFISDPLMPLGGYAVIGLASTWLLFALRADTLPARVLQIAPLAYIGRISYGLYLWHYPVLRLSQAYGLKHLPRDAAVLAVTFAAAALSYHFWECPVRKRVNARLQYRLLSSKKLHPEAETAQTISG